MTGHFARLEVVADLQVLLEVVKDDDVVRVRIRREGPLSTVIMIGNWGDTEAGWAAAQAQVQKADVEEIARAIDTMMKDLSRPNNSQNQQKND